MSTPHRAPSRNPIRRLAAGVSRWRNTRRGTATLKAAYAQAARDAKRMDPAVRAAVGRAKLGKEDLKALAHSQISAHANRDGGLAQQLDGMAAGQIAATDRPRQRTFNPVKMVQNRVTRWRETRQGTATLKAAFAQAARDAKRMDPAVREVIGRSKIGKADLAHFVKAQMAQSLDPRTAAARASAAGTHVPTAAPAGRSRPAHAAPSQSAGQRVANAVNTMSRWKNAVKSGSVDKARKFRDDYNERRQNPTGRAARAAQAAQPATGRVDPAWTAGPGQATPRPATLGQSAPAQTPGQGQSPEDKARLAKAFHASVNNSVPLASEAAEKSDKFGGQESGGGKHRAPDWALDGNAPASGAVKNAPKADKSSAAGQKGEAPETSRHGTATKTPAHRERD
ncbi:hypothetical protein FB561_7317 [Kribbella amoyensis]|uniref:Uncharacterized protein n=1 Tax=Kribbella amoyensis TaxID=996641 RepID=A0A561B3H5_9ACTN|nr:hypothetical protein [Kribbella amoyensis]TWD73428.1 hypothetical protein FB561_7317 [Kribbella amoyensis]